MVKKEELIKFNLTPEMSLELIKFNSMKRQLNELKELYNLDENKNLLNKIKKIEKELIISRNKFIKDFRLNNEEEIIKYLQIKDQL